MKQHKWHKEIKAWADGAEIEVYASHQQGWINSINPSFSNEFEWRIKSQKTEPLIIPEEPVAVVYSMQDGYVGQMIKKGLPHKTLLYAHQDKPQPKEPQYLYVFATQLNQIILRQYPTFFNNGEEIIGKIKLEVEE